MFLITNILTRNLRLIGRPACLRLGLNSRSFANKAPDSVDVDKPIVYTQSPANQWRAEFSRMGTSSAEERLWYEPGVVLVSLTIFMIYFCILREESDIDGELDKTLYSRIEGLEEQQLLITIKYREAQGLDTSLYEQRLKEVREAASSE